MNNLRSSPGFEGKLRQLFDGSQAWIIVSLIGISAGITAAFIVITADWLNDLRSGYCKTNWYLNRRFCCWEEKEGQDCDYWHNWAGTLQSGNAGTYLLGYLLYILFGVAFATSSAFLVRQYAPYAAGSGIPEVKTILSGFIIRKFLGVWTLIIKSIGLALSAASGLCLGKEGPLVHVACCCGNIFPRLFKKYSRNEGTATITTTFM